MRANLIVALIQENCRNYHVSSQTSLDFEGHIDGGFGTATVGNGSSDKGIENGLFAVERPRYRIGNVGKLLAQADEIHIGRVAGVHNYVTPLSPNVVAASAQAVAKSTRGQNPRILRVRFLAIDLDRVERKSQAHSQFRGKTGIGFESPNSLAAETIAVPQGFGMSFVEVDEVPANVVIV
jgi:hypothetical protein